MERTTAIPARALEHWPRRWPFPPGGAPVEAGRGIVATTDRLASLVGVNVLDQGGNAVDAAVAVSFALAVVNPEAGNLGGSGFLLARAPSGALATLDYRGCAPRAAAPDMFLDERLRAARASQEGHLAVAVPGSVRGLWEAHTRFGSLAWSRLVGPAVELAQGFPVEERLVRSYEPQIVRALERFPASAEIFLPNARVPRVGDVFRQPDLARTLERISERGADGFYLGETANLLVAEMRRGGGILTHDDLAGYTAVWRAPVRFRYRDHTIVSVGPPSSGGVTLALAAHVVARWNLRALAWHGALHVHLLAEAWRRAYADRNRFLADPDRERLPLEALLSPAYGAWRARDVSEERASRSIEVAPGADAFLAARERHTTHVSIVDSRGGAVSLTTTLNTWFGSKVVAEGTGVLLNNEMDDFTTRPGEPNAFGLVQGEANRIAPGKRMLSAMTPALVLDPSGRLAFVLGTPGGATIPTTTFQVVSNLVDHGMPLADAVAAPRVHHQHLPDRLEVEPGGLPEPVVEELRAMGHTVTERVELSGDVQAVGVRPDGRLEGVADPRRGGAALGL